MFRMGTVLSPESCITAHRRRILRRLSRLEVPEEYLDQGQSGLVAYAKSNKYRIAELVTAILPTHEDAMEASFEPRDGNIKEADEDIFHESMVWLMWLMFEGEPKMALDHLAKMNASHRGICGAVWGSNEIAYRCQTCAQDPTCGICVPCFENGDHKDHDYCVIYTTGGCCDCGDITAWKREGFCSKHEGIEQIKPLPEEYAKSLGPVLDTLLNYWKQKLKFAEINSKDSHDAKVQHTSDELTLAVVEALLLFCKHSESLLCFISGRVCSSFGLLEVLLQAERFIRDGITRKLHELLLKLLAEPIFKYEFAKAFLRYYPTIINEAVKDCSDTIFKKYPLLPIFSVQIFPLPSLTPLLIEDMNLLSMLLDCLGNIFISCAGEDGKLQVSKWESLYETTFRVVEDIRLVMNHSIAPKYICQGRLDLVRMWMKLLAFVQGMSPQKRAIAGHVEDSDENMHLTFFLGHNLMKILSILVAEAFSVTSIEETNKQSKTEFEDQDGQRNAKIRKLSWDSSFCSITGKSTLSHASSAAELNIGSFPVPSSGLWLTFECLRGIGSWLGVDNTVGSLGVLSPITSKGSVNNPCGLKGTLCEFGTVRDIFKSCTAPFPNDKLTSLSEVLGKQGSLPSNSGLLNGVDFESEQYTGSCAVSGGSVGNVLERENVAELEGHKALSLSYWPDIIYDVSSQNISAHIPLHRLLSMILQAALKQCYGEYAPLSLVSSNSADPSSVPHGNFFGHILGGCHPYGFSAFLMEHPLRIRVFCAEVHSGMWCRNGDDPTVSIECYRSVPCSELGQDLDLFLLQCCAALAPPDLYVRRILERFGLLNYLSLNLERSIENEPVLVVEMLTLLIQIVKERRYSGLTATECLQRELIYKLSIGDSTRSQLVESLPRDLCTVSELQEIVDTIAEYSSPSGLTQGKYKLRSAYRKELDLYHPRLKSRDLQTSVERYFRVFGTSAFTSQLPKWTKIYYPLRVIAQVATCKAVLEIIRAVLFYAVFTDKLALSRAPDDIVLTSLHLLALALDICQVERSSGDLLCAVSNPIPILGFACEEIFMNKSGDQSMISLLVLLMRIHEKENAKNFMEAGNFNLSLMIGDILKKFVEFEPECMIKLQKLAPGLIDRHSQSLANGYSNGTGSASDCENSKMKAQERQAAILEKMRAQQRKFLASMNSSADDDIDDSKSGQDICDSCVENNPQESAQAICCLCRGQNSSSPVSFLVLLQKSRLLSLVERGSPSWEQVSCSEKEPASKRTIRINELPQRSSSISGGSGMISSSQTQFPSIKNVQLPYISKDTREKTVFSLETLEEHMYFKIRGVSHVLLWELDSRSKDDLFPLTGGRLESSGNVESLLLGKYSAGLSKETWKNPPASENINSRSDRAQSETGRLHPEADGFDPIGSDGICVSSCGHAVHQRCLDGYLSSHEGWHDEGGHAVDPDEGGFLCPLCRGLANCVLPASFRELRRVPQSPAISTVDSTYNDSPSTSSDRDATPLRLQDALYILKSAADVARSNEIQKVFPIQQSVGVRPDLEPMFRVLSAMFLPGEDKMLESSGITRAIILWDALKYSITSAEIAARSRNNSLHANYSLSALYKEVNSTNGFILSLLLNATKSLRIENSLCVLLRLRGSQLFAESICSGTSPNKYSSYRWQQEGNMLYIMDNAEAEIQFPDIQLCELACEPVLARDAFSSLMWTLFCLPWPFLSCKESYQSLVHAFYVVNITKAIITYCKRGQFNISEFGNQDCLITDIYKFIGEQGEAQHYSDTNYINPSYDVKDAIRSLSFPYLRRCAFLWKLINHSNSVPFSDVPNQLDGQYVADDVMEGNNIELYEIEKLEKMFNIPPLGVIINDEKSRLAALRWLHHLSEESEAQKVYSGLNCTPAVPFCLIRLPYLYQDLLQRYIKKHCPDCGTVPEEPALCLLCGKLCSPNWKPCCRASDCRTHGMACGAGIGVFLLIRRTAILLLRSAHQKLWPSPYLDAFGEEEDTEMQRGKPLFLSEERYAALAHMVASHGLDPSSKLFQ